MNIKKVLLICFAIIVLQPFVYVFANDADEDDDRRIKLSSDSGLNCYLKDPKKIAEQEKARILAGTFKTCSKKGGKFYRR